jgi:hypothetical protein
MGAYDLSPMPKFYVELKGAGHFVWTDLRRTFHDPIVAYSIAFLDHYVRGSDASPLLYQGGTLDFGITAALRCDRCQRDLAAPHQTPENGARSRRMAAWDPARCKT